MTFGQIIFYSGFGLLGVTLILMVIFLVKRPRYIPENAAHEIKELDQTQQLRSGYPTDPLTRRHNIAGQRQPQATARLPQNPTGSSETAVLGAPPQGGTVPLQSTGIPPQGTMPLQNAAVPPRETVPLSDAAPWERPGQS